MHFLQHFFNRSVKIGRKRKNWCKKVELNITNKPLTPCIEDQANMSKLRQDYSPHEDLFEDLTRCMRGPNDKKPPGHGAYRVFLLASPGSGTGIHKDAAGTHVWSSLISGRKR